MRQRIRANRAVPDMTPDEKFAEALANARLIAAGGGAAAAVLGGELAELFLELIDSGHLTRPDRSPPPRKLYRTGRPERSGLGLPCAA